MSLADDAAPVDQIEAEGRAGSGRGECTAAGCDRPAHCRGWCTMHYSRWHRTGSLDARPRFSDPEDAFLARTEPLPWSGCLIWTGATVRGYGMLAVRGENTYAHRYAWERANGPIPDDMMIDHRYHCSTLCCEVSHLRVATAEQNARNRRGATRASRTGVRGVRRYGDGWAAQAKLHGRPVIEPHATYEEAVRAAPLLRRGLYGEDYAGGD